MKHYWIIAACLLVGPSGCSCYDLQNDIEECKIGIRNHFAAKKSWHSCGKYACTSQNVCDYRKGYIAGYVGGTTGGQNCTPAQPPNCYWGLHYQSPEGQCCVRAWFDGYEAGAAAAEAEGARGMNTIYCRPPATPPMEHHPDNAGAISPVPDALGSPAGTPAPAVIHSQPLDFSNGAPPLGPSY